eukprot:3125824-Lingulodinium_polyedra.AAC.1
MLRFCTAAVVGLRLPVPAVLRVFHARAGGGGLGVQLRERLAVAAGCRGGAHPPTRGGPANSR